MRWDAMIEHMRERAKSRCVLTFEKLGCKFLYFRKVSIHFSAASTLPNLFIRSEDTKHYHIIAAYSTNPYPLIKCDIIPESVKIFWQGAENLRGSIADMACEGPYTDDLPKLPSHRQELLLGKVGRKTIDVDVRRLQFVGRR